MGNVGNLPIAPDLGKPLRNKGILIPMDLNLRKYGMDPCGDNSGNPLIPKTVFDKINCTHLELFEKGVEIFRCRAWMTLKFPFKPLPQAGHFIRRSRGKQNYRLQSQLSSRFPGIIEKRDLRPPWTKVAGPKSDLHGDLRTKYSWSPSA